MRTVAAAKADAMELVSTPETDIRAIEARHTQDAVWFNAGHHDPNGYVAMAHKDRGVLIDYIRRKVPRPCTVAVPTLPYVATGEPRFDTFCGAPTPPLRLISIPKAAYDWLMGHGPDDKGDTLDPLWFTIRLEALRSTFRRMCGL